ncbi:MAG: NADH-quinone oxidoreductase subunit NuoF, partial [bacterium]|nr:NADH-quinone oxidoreductase subunit NuoF [bacterium]
MSGQREQKIGLRNVGHISPHSIADYIARGGYEGFRKALRMTPDMVVKEVEDSGLRGRGGAGFPTGTKWKFTRASADPVKYVISNADEGEPGTFKDRVIMEGDPHTHIEGLMIAAYAVGAPIAYIYIRGEFYESIDKAYEAIEAAKKKGFLGENILGSGFSLDMQIKLGGGSYLCGEESALIESLEGKRGYPRIKPPYPAQIGVFDKPTAVNNVETLSHVPEIIRHGASWYRTMGTEKSPGTKIFTVCGDVQKPGCYETEMGTPLREIIYEMAGGIRDGKLLKAVLVGGAAGTFLPTHYIDISMDYDSLKEKEFVLGSGALIVMAEDKSIKDTLQDITRFFHHESCGKCVPCRVGTRQLQDMMKPGDSCDDVYYEQLLDRMLKLSDMMDKTSLCPLGQSPIFAVRSALDHFRPELIKTM